MSNFDINLINPYIRYASRSILKHNTEINRRVIFDYELIYLEKGSFLFNYNDIDYTCHEGTFIFIRPDIPHSFKCILGDISQPHIHFDFIYNDKSLDTPISFKDKCDFTKDDFTLLQEDLFNDFPKTPFILFFNKAKILELFFQIIDSYNGTSTLKSKALLTEIINTIITDNYRAVLPYNESALQLQEIDISEQIKNFIDAGQGIAMSLDDFENLFSYDKFYLERKFKIRYGCSLIAYRNTHRMNIACKMLNKNTVSAVAEQLGFSSIYSFSRAFKNHFGVSPTDYKL